MATRTIRRNCSTVVCIASALVSPLALANYACKGLLDFVDVDPTGIVIVNSNESGLNSVYLCSVAST